MSTLVAEVRAEKLVVTEDSLIVNLSDGRSMTVPARVVSAAAPWHD